MRMQLPPSHWPSSHAPGGTGGSGGGEEGRRGQVAVPDSMTSASCMWIDDLVWMDGGLMVD